MNYQEEISENSDFLFKFERETRDLKARDRIRFIRLLKTGKAATQSEAGALIGIKTRQAQRLWKQYRKEGIKAMGRSNYKGGTGKLSEADKAQLKERLKADDIGSLEQARQILREDFSVEYTIGGVSYLFKQMRVKLKTGRPHNIKQDAEAVQEFKKKNIRL